MRQAVPWVSHALCLKHLWIDQTGWASSFQERSHVLDHHGRMVVLDLVGCASPLMACRWLPLAGTWRHHVVESPVGVNDLRKRQHVAIWI